MEPVESALEALGLQLPLMAAPGGNSPRVINGASDLFAKIYGDRGLHARAAIGVSGLPRNALVEIQMVVGVRRDPE